MISVSVLVVCISQTHPFLLFDASDREKLLEYAQSQHHAYAWKVTLDTADGYINPASDLFADPATVNTGGEHRPLVLQSHAYGNRLSSWMETLGFVYQVTGDERYGRHAADLLLETCRAIPASDPRMAHAMAGGRGDMMRGLALGYDWVGHLLSDADRAFVADVSAGYVRAILADASKKGQWWVPYHNFMGVAVGAAGCLAISLQDVYPDESSKWRDQCADRIREWLSKGWDAEGAYVEGTGYGMYGLSNTVLFADALLRQGGPNLFQHPHLARMPHFYAMSLLPGEPLFDARNDANYVGFNDPFMLRIAGAQNSGLARSLWNYCGETIEVTAIIWENEVAPVDPLAAGEPLAERFVDRGLCIFRTGWERNDVMFSIEAGPYFPGTHDQADEGHFTLYGLGHRWAIDSGYGNNQDPTGRCQTVAHNGILVDGDGQALTGAGLGNDGELLSYDNNDRFGYALVDAAQGYRENSSRNPGIPMKRARRMAIFVRPADGLPAYVAIFDDIQQDDKPHEYAWLLHPGDDMAVAFENGDCLVTPKDAGNDSPRMHVVVRASSDVVLEQDLYETHPRVWAKAKAIEPQFTAVLAPLPAAIETPVVEMSHDSETRRVTVTWSSRVDTIEWPLAKRSPEVNQAAR